MYQAITGAGAEMILDVRNVMCSKGLIIFHLFNNLFYFC